MYAISAVRLPATSQVRGVGNWQDGEVLRYRLCMIRMKKVALKFFGRTREEMLLQSKGTSQRRVWKSTRRERNISRR
jgi:hypothetical protein